MDHFEELVVKSRSGWGGKDVLIAPQESSEDIERFREMVEENPVEYVARRRSTSPPTSSARPI